MIPTSSLSSRTKQVDAVGVPQWLRSGWTDFRKVIGNFYFDPFQFGDAKFLNGNRVRARTLIAEIKKPGPSEREPGSFSRQLTTEP